MLYVCKVKQKQHTMKTEQKKQLAAILNAWAEKEAAGIMKSMALGYAKDAVSEDENNNRFAHRFAKEIYWQLTESRTPGSGKHDEELVKAFSTYFTEYK